VFILKISVDRADVLIMCQQLISDQFAESNTTVRGIEFIDSSGKASKISRIEVDFHNQK
jgi:hypothetical protein